LAAVCSTVVANKFEANLIHDMDFASVKLLSVTYLELYLARKERGRPKTTWKKTAEKERNLARWTSWSAQTVFGCKHDSLIHLLAQ